MRGKREGVWLELPKAGSHRVDHLGVILERRIYSWVGWGGRVPVSRIDWLRGLGVDGSERIEVGAVGVGSEWRRGKIIPLFSHVTRPVGLVHHD